MKFYIIIFKNLKRYFLHKVKMLIIKELYIYNFNNYYNTNYNNGIYIKLIKFIKNSKKKKFQIYSGKFPTTLAKYSLRIVLCLRLNSIAFAFSGFKHIIFSPDVKRSKRFDAKIIYIIY